MRNNKKDTLNSPEHQAEYLRISEISKIYSISVSKVHEYIKAGRVRSINLCDPGQKRGVRLIAKADFLKFLESHAEGGDQ